MNNDSERVLQQDVQSAKNEDIKVFGKLVPASTEGVIASAANIWDDNKAKNQQDVNIDYDNKIDNVEHKCEQKIQIATTYEDYDDLFNSYKNAVTDEANKNIHSWCGGCAYFDGKLVVSHEYGIWTEYNLYDKTCKVGVFDTYSGYNNSNHAVREASHGMNVGFSKQNSNIYIYTVNTVNLQLNNYIDVFDWNTKLLVQRLDLNSIRDLFNGYDGFHEFSIDGDYIYFWYKDSSKKDETVTRYVTKVKLPSVLDGKDVQLTITGNSRYPGLVDASKDYKIFQYSSTTSVKRNIKLYSFNNKDIIYKKKTLNSLWINYIGDKTSDFFVTNTNNKPDYQQFFVHNDVAYMSWWCGNNDNGNLGAYKLITLANLNESDNINWSVVSITKGLSKDLNEPEGLFVKDNKLFQISQYRDDYYNIHDVIEYGTSGSYYIKKSGDTITGDLYTNSSIEFDDGSQAYTTITPGEISISDDNLHTEINSGSIITTKYIIIGGTESQLLAGNGTTANPIDETDINNLFK